jgi:H+-transporting ATP synthase F0 complex subunit s
LIARPFTGWFNAAFNKYDQSRVDEVGPDRAAAEWLLRCGAAVRWQTGTSLIKDYNSLPVGNYKNLKIQEIDGTDSAIMEEGFLYLKGLKELRKMSMVNNKYLNDESIFFLVAYTKNRLTDLHLANNGTISAAGLLHLVKMQELRHLHLEGLQEVRGPEEVLATLQRELPGCCLRWPPHTEEPGD